MLLLCEPEGIQTLDLQNRNLTLYSAKLRVPFVCLRVQKYSFFFNRANFWLIIYLDCRFICNFAPQIESGA